MEDTLPSLTRFASFRRVLSEAVQAARAESAKRGPAPSPAYTAYKAATTNAERAAAYALFTRADQEFLDTSFEASRAAHEARIKADRSADQARCKARRDAEIIATKAAEDARIAALPPSRRSLAEFCRSFIYTAKLLGHIFLVCIFIPKLVFGALVMLIYMVIAAPVLLIFYWRDVGPVVKALPAATRVLITAR